MTLTAVVADQDEAQPTPSRTTGVDGYVVILPGRRVENPERCLFYDARAYMLHGERHFPRPEPPLEPLRYEGYEVMERWGISSQELAEIFSAPNNAQWHGPGSAAWTRFAERVGGPLWVAGSAGVGKLCPHNLNKDGRDDTFFTLKERK